VYLSIFVSGIVAEECRDFPRLASDLHANLGSAAAEAEFRSNAVCAGTGSIEGKFQQPSHATNQTH